MNTQTLRIERRAWLAAAVALALPALARADGGRWLPDGPAGGKVLLPEHMRVIAPLRTAEREFAPDGRHARRAGSAVRTRTGGVALEPLRQPPTAYVLTGQRLGVPAWVLFGVALQESQLLFGHEALPWPWTLDVAGRAERHGS
jgi:hypothetical protein